MPRPVAGKKMGRWTLGLVCNDVKKRKYLAHTGVRTPDRPARIKMRYCILKNFRAKLPSILNMLSEDNSQAQTGPLLTSGTLQPCDYVRQLIPLFLMQ